jgi:hypothetical protein
MYGYAQVHPVVPRLLRVRGLNAVVLICGAAVLLFAALTGVWDWPRLAKSRSAR